MAFDSIHWQTRLDALRTRHHVPGATLAVLHDGVIDELASGVLHRGTGVTATPDAVFQSGSIAKVYTATLVLQLVDEGRLGLDERVADVLPGFAVADPAATRTVTVRQLLTHTSGISGDFTLDTGRGDDCLARYVDACAAVSQDCPPGTMISYCSTGYAVLGRIVEVLTGQTWDDALAQRLLAPLGLRHSMTLPEEALRFRVAMGHRGEPGRDPEPATVWDHLPRSAGPYGRVLVTAGDVVRFARMHLDGGAGVLSERSVAAMQRPEVATPDRWTFGTDAWGLGWALYDFGDVRGYGHDGASIGQYSYLRVVPESGVAVALLTNGGGAPQLAAAMLGELLGDLAHARVAPAFSPPTEPSTVDGSSFVGVYRREGTLLTVTEHNGDLRLRYELTGGVRGFAAPTEIDLIAVSDTVFAASGRGFGDAGWLPVVFTSGPDGCRYAALGMRVTPAAR